MRIGQYDNARMQLREGAFKSLRMDLGYGQEMYRLVSQQVRAGVSGCRSEVEGVLAGKHRHPPQKPLVAGCAARNAQQPNYEHAVLPGPCAACTPEVPDLPCATLAP